MRKNRPKPFFTVLSVDGSSGRVILPLPLQIDVPSPPSVEGLPLQAANLSTIISAKSNVIIRFIENSHFVSGCLL